MSDQKETKTSKKAIVITAIVLAAVIAVAAIVYYSLASTALPENFVQATEESDSASSEGSSATQGSASDSSSSRGDETTSAPDFTMTNIDGDELTLSSLESKPVVLNFWASTCGPCKNEMPEFQSLFEEYGEKVNFAMVNVPDFNGETHERALNLIKENGYTFPVYFQVDEEASIKYGITSIPRTYFINTDGDVEAYASGSIDRESILTGINMIIS